ncbi:unnamed protein product [Rhizophagus irregularis]|nr:unnamed protein product [Rhizophagus irregularis]
MLTFFLGDGWLYLYSLTDIQAFLNLSHFLQELPSFDLTIFGLILKNNPATSSKKKYLSLYIITFVFSIFSS